MTQALKSEASDSLYQGLNRAMVEDQIRRRGVRDERVLEAMLRVPRHEFLPPEQRAAAYTDQPLPIGGGQTISQPYMVAAMAEALQLSGPEKVLEVGAGSGYQAAVLSMLAREIHTVEIHPRHAAEAAERLSRLHFSNVRVHEGDGSRGFAPEAPYDAILVTAAAPEVPPLLLEQLREGGRLVVPVGDEREQQLLRVRKGAQGRIEREGLIYCRFVPLRGEFGWSVAEWMQP